MDDFTHVKYIHIYVHVNIYTHRYIYVNMCAHICSLKSKPENSRNPRNLTLKLKLPKGRGGGLSKESRDSVYSGGGLLVLSW